jgi:hypothetical protein
MNYRVVWLDRPLEHLAQHYAPLYGTDRGKQITSAMAEVDRRLSADPVNVGESRSGHSRFVFEHPLCVTFEVAQDDGTVVVTQLGVRWRRDA